MRWEIPSADSALHMNAQRRAATLKTALETDFKSSLFVSINQEFARIRVDRMGHPIPHSWAYRLYTTQWRFEPTVTVDPASGRSPGWRRGWAIVNNDGLRIYSCRPQRPAYWNWGQRRRLLAVFAWHLLGGQPAVQLYPTYQGAMAFVYTRRCAVEPPGRPVWNQGQSPPLWSKWGWAKWCPPVKQVQIAEYDQSDTSCLGGICGAARRRQTPSDVGGPRWLQLAFESKEAAADMV